ncbi:MAG: hypothetical protein IPJ88_18840 [Myxococcales bacterium]|nr:MAG: hypothetical protein IPJ88_18840 [Myxococcales bacterium]
MMPALPARRCPDGQTAGPVCLKSNDGKCSWKIAQCLTVAAENPILAGKGCVAGGCSGQLCIEKGSDRVSTCEWREEYACYRSAICERTNSGQCAWRQTKDLKDCLGAKSMIK